MTTVPWPQLLRLYNRSMSTGFFPDRYKMAYITPLIKKPGLVTTDTRSYRIKFACCIKVAWTACCKESDRLSADYQSNNLLPDQQSAYWPGFSTETTTTTTSSQQFTTTSVTCGVSQEWILGPILFIMSTPDLVRLIEHHGLSPHLFADDTQRRV